MKYFLQIILLLLVSCSQNKPEEKLNEVDFCAKIHTSKTTALSHELKDFSKFSNEKTGVYVLEDGGGSLVTRAWLCENAGQSIDIQYFIFSTDNVGLIAIDYLVKAADRGIKVRIIIDDIMVDADLEDVLTLNSHENIDIKIYNPGVNLGKNILSKIKKFTTEFRNANQRMHNKTFIVDEKVVITGGRNVADEYFDYDHEYNFRDRDVLLLGKVTKDVNISFAQFWNEYNKPWLDAAINRGDDMVPATNPEFNVLARANKSGKYELSGYGKEYLHLRKNGYSSTFKKNK